MMKSYENIESDISMASEPQMAFGNVQATPPIQVNSYEGLPEGYMTLQCFGELFHQKLDACYAELRSNS